MSKGGYDRGEHAAITAARVSKPREEVFKERKLHPAMNPFGTMRESRDEKTGAGAGMRSRAVMIKMDDSGSMQHIPDLLAKDILPTFMTTVLDLKIFERPHVLIGTYGDAVCHGGTERSSLQVGQFEAEAHLMDQDLTRIDRVGGGGGNEGESADLAIYYAARHTSIDCYELRKEKGYLYLTGDEPTFTRVSAEAIRRIIGDDVRTDIPFEDIVAECAKKYHIFFQIPDLNRRSYGKGLGCERFWRQYLGDNVICQEAPEDTCLVSAALAGLTEGTFADLDAMQEALTGLGTDKEQIGRIYRAVEPYAASIGRSGQRRETEDGDLPTGQGKTRTRRR